MTRNERIITAVLLTMLFAAGWSAALGCTDSDGASSPRLVSASYDSSAGDYIIVTADQNLDGDDGTHLFYRYTVQDEDFYPLLNGITASNSNMLRIRTDSAITPDDKPYKITEGSYTIAFENPINDAYEMIVYKVSFVGEGKTESVYVSEDGLSGHHVPDGYKWNTKIDGSGDWITDLSSLRFEDGKATLYVFKDAPRGMSAVSETFTVIKGSDATVLISLGSNSGINGLEMDIYYDESAMSLKSARSCNGMTLAKSSLSGSPYNAILTSSSDIFSTGALLQLTFAVSSDAECGQYPVYVIVSGCVSMDGKDVPADVSGCAVKVGEKMRGDLDGNGKINSSDSLLLRKYLARQSVDIDAGDADLTGDGKVSGLDSLLLRKYLAKQPVVFADFPAAKVAMTVTDGTDSANVNGVSSGTDVFLESDTSIIVAASGTETEVQSIDGRCRFAAPSENFTVRIS